MKQREGELGLKREWRHTVLGQHQRFRTILVFTRAITFMSIGGLPQRWMSASILMSAVVLLALVAVDGKEKKPEEPRFKYVGGTELIQQGCKGNLELTSEALTFRCSGGSIRAPYSSISLMEYRSGLSRQVQKMKIRWNVKPATKHSKRNRYFTVLYSDGGSARAIVLDVTPEAMRPYLAEIDLKAGKRVEVESHEEYNQ